MTSSRVMLAIAAAAILSASLQANGVPAFNRQTGQNCVACHAGGQFPDLTTYGRLFKLTGYTIGERAMPLALMAVASANKTKNTGSPDPNFDARANFPKDGLPIFQTASLFLAGRVTNNIGAFVQVTYGNYDSQSPIDSHWSGHTTSDNLDIRYADRFITPERDLIFGATMNNNPGVQDPWNSIPAWGYNVVPGSSGPGATPLIAGGLAQNVAGWGGYMFWNRTLYAELTGYRTANGLWSFMSQGFNNARGNMQVVKGTNPYWRVALAHDWGAHSAMVGAYGLTANVYPDATDPTGSTSRYRDNALDAQYQYILDPHAVTVTATYVHERVDYADSLAGQFHPLDPDGSLGLPLTNASDTLRMFRAKASYVYGARYGGSVSYFDVRGSANSALQTSAFDPANPGTLLDGSQGVLGSLAGNPGTRAWTAEAFWTPMQNIRLGVEYTAFTRFNGASSNYDGFGRNASDNNTVFLYAWTAF
ncbi:MAG TPA: cytochrome C [Usitatibacter sp.]|nr:cytochrome C [Usitatibacter sp.]